MVIYTRGMSRPALVLVAVIAMWAVVPSVDSPAVSAQSNGTTQPAPSGQVIGARSYSPMVANVDMVASFYARLGLSVPPPDDGHSYPWDKEIWHFELHGGDAPRSPMRFMYATVPGAVPPATPLLVEPVEHRDIARQTHPLRVQDPGATTLVLLVRDLMTAAMRVPDANRGPVRRVGVYGGSAQAMTVSVPGAHLVELLQLDPIPATTAPAAANVIGAWVRVAVEDMDRTLNLYRDHFGLRFTVVEHSDADLGGIVGAPRAKLRLATTTLPGTAMRLEFLEVKGVDRRPLHARVQDPGAARLQLTVKNLETTLETLRRAGRFTIASARGQIITQPGYRVIVVSDLNGLFLVLTDRRQPR